jgi:hypothetical protein
VSIGNISISITIASISTLPTCIIRIRIRLLSSTRSHALPPLVTSSSRPASPRDKVHLHALSCLICLGAQPEYPDSPGSCFLTSTLPLPPPPKPEFEPANFSQTLPSEKLRNDRIQLDSLLKRPNNSPPPDLFTATTALSCRDIRVTILAATARRSPNTISSLRAIITRTTPPIRLVSRPF